MKDRSLIVGDETAADDRVGFSKYLPDLRNAIREDTINKINKENRERPL